VTAVSENDRRRWKGGSYKQNGYSFRQERRRTSLFGKSALRAIREAGLRVPEDVSVTGFDDIPDAAACAPPLTTVRLPIRPLGDRAAEILLSQIETQAPAGQKEVLPTEVIMRASVAPPTG
jgi:DNA-binding LacI/PurR family transcriptional regulator